ncbi:fibronectin type III domain-containing protein [Candidatus Margulisiibacteriota bacterium]
MNKIQNLILITIIALSITSCSALQKALNGNGDTTSPSEVTNLIQTPKDKAITLSWTNPTESDFNHVEITYVWLSTTTSVPKGTNYKNITNLTNDQTYNFVVKTVDNNNNKSSGLSISSTPTASVSTADVTAPAAVTNLSTTILEQAIVLTWTDPVDIDLSHIEIIVSSQNTTNVVSAGTGTKTISNLTNNVEYVFTVYAVDSSDNKSNPAYIAAAPGDSTAPDEISGISAVAEDTKVTVSWVDPANNDLDHIKITYPGLTTPILVSSNVQTYELTNLTNDQTYTITIQTVDVNNNVSTGIDVQATPTTPPAQPKIEVTNLAAQSGNGKISLSWQESSTADIKHIEISYTGLGQNIVVTKSIETYAVTGLTNGTNYLFTIYIVDSSDVKSDGKQISATPVNTKPIAVIDSVQTNTCFLTDAISLSGANSSDSDDDTLTYSWSLTSSPSSSSPTLSSTSAANPSITMDKYGTYIVQLTVNDGLVSSDATTIVLNPKLKWEDISISATTKTTSTLYYDNGTLYASLANEQDPTESGLYKTSISSISWADITPAFTLNNPSIDQHDKSITQFNNINGVLYAAMQWVGLYRSEDSGSNWSLVLEPANPAEGITKVVNDPNATNSLLAGTRNGSQANSSDNGQNWTVYEKGPGDGGSHTSALQYDSNDSETIFSGCGSTQFFKISEDNASTWTNKATQDFPADSHIIGIGQNSNGVYLFFVSGTVLLTNDDGDSYTTLLSDKYSTTGDVNEYVVEDDLIICGSNKLFYSTDNGSSFTEVEMSSEHEFRSVYIINNKVYIIGEGIFRTSKWW